MVRTIDTDTDHKGFRKVEDAWGGHAHDAVEFGDPDTGSPYTWVGTTSFVRVMPEPPRGKHWVGDESFRTRRGSMKPDNVTPHSWWLMGAGEKLDAMNSWRKLSAKIREAKARRSIPMEPLETMPTLIDNWLVAKTVATEAPVSGGLGLASPGLASPAKIVASKCDFCEGNAECLFCDDSANKNIGLIQNREQSRQSVLNAVASDKAGLKEGDMSGFGGDELSRVASTKDVEPA